MPSHAVGLSASLSFNSKSGERRARRRAMVLPCRSNQRFLSGLQLNECHAKRRHRKTRDLNEVDRLAEAGVGHQRRHRRHKIDQRGRARSGWTAACGSISQGPEGIGLDHLPNPNEPASGVVRRTGRSTRRRCLARSRERKDPRQFGRINLVTTVFLTAH